MNLFSRSLLALLVAGLPLLAHADDYSFEFKTEKKKTEGHRSTSVSETVSKEKWCYAVTIENHSFKDIADIQVKYIVYLKQQPQGGRVAVEKHNAGATTIATLQNNGSFAFTTNPIDLTRTELENGYYWANGADSRSWANLNGIWIRLYKDGKMIGEYADPSRLSRGKWGN